jgi:transcriptional regulator
MYVPKHFAVEERSALLSFIKREPFGILISNVDGKPFATHAPFVILEDSESLKLGVHVAKANPQWRTIDGQNVLAVFHGMHGMISAGWYGDPERSVPTWNYSAVHCSGRGRIGDAATTRRIVEKIVDTFESSWRIENADPDYIDRMFNAIVGIEIALDSIDGAFKRSQNRTVEDRLRVIKALSASNRSMDRELADEMAADLDRA